MPYQKRNARPDNTQHNLICHDTLVDWLRGDAPCNFDRAVLSIRQYLLALQHLPLAIHLESFTTRELNLVSDAFAQMHGYSQNELEGVLLSDLCVPACRPKLAHYGLVAMKAGDAVFDTEHERKDGSTFPIHVEMRLMRQERDEVLLSVVSDRTGTASLESTITAELKRYVRAFEKLQQERDDAHQEMIINTHLTHRHLDIAIIMTEMVLNAAEYDLSLADMRGWRNWAEMLAEVYSILLTDQRAGNWSHEVPLRSLLEKQLAPWQSAYSNRPFHWECVEVRLEVRQFLALIAPLHEIVKNAFVHGAGTVTVTITDDNGQLTLVVRDQGPGFAPGFEPRTGGGPIGSETTGGLGIVSATQWGTSSIQGEVRYENVPEGGAQVMLRFAMS